MRSRTSHHFQSAYFFQGKDVQPCTRFPCLPDRAWPESGICRESRFQVSTPGFPAELPHRSGRWVCRPSTWFHRSGTLSWVVHFSASPAFTALLGRSRRHARKIITNSQRQTKDVLGWEPIQVYPLNTINPRPFVATGKVRTMAQTMNPIAKSSIVFALVFGGALCGIFLRTVLPANYCADTKDIVKLGMALVSTMAALVLGLLIASAKSSYDAQIQQWWKAPQGSLFWIVSRALWT